MKNLLKNKKFLLGAISLMIGVSVLMMGFTYAWFTSSGAFSQNSSNMGSLKAEAVLDNNVYSVAEPGIALMNQIGRVQNLEDISALLKLTFSAKVTLKSDADGNPIENPDDYVIIENDPNVTVQIQEGGDPENDVPELGFWYDTNYEEIYICGEYDGSIYWAMMGNRELSFAYTVELSGNMGNEYQNAEIELSVIWEATQLMVDGAINDIFGADILNVWNEFGGDHQFESFGLFSFSADRGSVLDNMPDCSFKTLVESKIAG